MAELGNRPEPGVAPSGLAVQVIRAFREPSTQSAPPTPVADTFSAAQPETDTQAEADAQVPAAAQAEAAAQAAAEQGAAVDDAGGHTVDALMLATTASHTKAPAGPRNRQQ
eukprot:1151834-Pelagomonas_calceolata.AAC.3